MHTLMAQGFSEATAMYAEAQELCHQRGAELVRAHRELKEVRCETEEVLQLRWRRGPADRFIAQEVLHTLQEEVQEGARLLHSEASAERDADARKDLETLRAELQDVASTVETLSGTQRSMQEESLMELRRQQLATSSELHRAQRLLEASTSRQLAAAEERFATKAVEAAEVAIAGAARTVAERLVAAEGKHAEVYGRGTQLHDNGGVAYATPAWQPGNKVARDCTAHPFNL